MTDPIDLSHVSVSPHQEAYEAFLQYDRFLKGEPFDPDTGLYGMAKEAFGAFHWEIEQSVFKTERVYPPIQKGGDLPSDEKIRKEVQKGITLWEKTGYPFAAQTIATPDGHSLLEAGKAVTKEALERIAAYNVVNKGGRPIVKIPLLDPRDDEGDILSDVIRKEGEPFDGSLFRRMRQGTATLSGYRIALPHPLSASSADDPGHIESLAWKILQAGGSLTLRVDLEFEVREDRVLTYNGQDIGRIAGKAERVWRELGAFPLFTPKATLVIRGQERVPVIQLLSGPGIYLSPMEKDKPRVLLLRPEQGPSLKIYHAGDDEGYSMVVEALGEIYDLRLVLNACNLWDDAEAVLTGPDPQHPLMPLPGVALGMTSVSFDWTSRFYAFVFKETAGFHLGDAVRGQLNERFSESFHALGIQAPTNPDRLSVEDVCAIIHYLHYAAINDLPGDDPSDLDRLKAFLLHDQIRRELVPVFQQLKKEIQAVLNKDPDPPSFRCDLRYSVDKKLQPLFQGELCQPADGTNPLAEVSLRRKVTLKGRGGIRHTQSMLPAHRQVHPSHYARVCLAETPESESMGLNLHLALTARVEQGTIKAAYRLKNEKLPRWLSFAEERDQTLVPKTASARSDRSTLLARRSGRVEIVHGLETTGEELYQGQILGIAAGLIPFVQHDDNNRVMMGAKNMKQAVPLLLPETPLVRTGWEGVAARMSGHAVYARRAGTVEQVLADQVIVRADEGGKDHYPLAAMRPTFHGTVAFHRVRVRRGDEVRNGQALADGACTRNGELALGVNLLTAYMPYYGLNFEDGIVISDRLVKEDTLTSLHLRSEEMEVYGDEDTRWDKKTQGPVPRVMLDVAKSNGQLVSPGQEVRPGDPIFVKYKREPVPDKKGVYQPRGGAKPFKKYHRSTAKGTVISVEEIPVEANTANESHVRFRKICWIMEERKAAVGDKLMGRHGNKGVISRIVPSHEMPHLEDGTPVDILLNPHGVVSRMNLGQILETHLGWILWHDPEAYQHLAVVPPFQKVPEEAIQDAFRALGHTGITPEGKAHLWDPRSGQRIKAPVTVGYQYVMKLNHLVEDKIHSRETGDLTLITGQPVKGKRRGGGQRVGEMEVWGLLAHRARALLQEFLTLKADSPKEMRKSLVRDYLKPSKKGPAPFPETLRSALMLVRGLGLDLRFHNNKGEPLDIRGEMTQPDHATIRFADESTIKAWAKNRQVKDAARPTLVRGVFEPKTDSLFHGDIFEDRRFDMGYIQLVEPVIHPLLYTHLAREMTVWSRKSSHLELQKGSPLHLLSFASFLPVGLEGVGPLDRRGFISVPADGEFLAGASLVKHLMGKTGQTGDAPPPPALERSLIQVVPVLPLDFRPLRAGQGGVVMSSSLNELYREVLLADHALKKALEAGQPGRVLFYARARLQRAVNRLMLGDGKAEPAAEKGIADLIKGKEGIFRMHILGKRVDVSARSVIVSMPELRLDEIGIPLELALGLVKSRLIDLLSTPQNGEKNLDATRRAEQILASIHEPVYREVVRKRIFEDILKDAWLVLNRAPSLHKYNVLAFRPVYVPHQAIGLHPLVCGMFNADFDGDQMAVHLPLDHEAMAEAQHRLSPLNNLLSAANGRPMLHLSQDIALGIYLLTSSPEGRKKFAEWFGGIIKTPAEPVTKKKLVDLVVAYYSQKKDARATADLAQTIMDEGFRQATLAGATLSIFDVPLVGRQELEDLKKTFPDAESLEKAVRADMRSLCGM